MINNHAIDITLEAVKAQIQSLSETLNNECSVSLTDWDDVFFFAEQIQDYVTAAKYLIKSRKG